SKLGGSHLRWRLKRLRRRISTSSRRLWRLPPRAWSSVAPICPNKALRVRAAFFSLLCFWWPELRPTHRSRSPSFSKSCAGGGSSASELRRIQCATVEIVNDPGVAGARRILRNVPHANLDCMCAGLAHKWMGADRDALYINLSVCPHPLHPLRFNHHH